MKVSLDRDGWRFVGIGLGCTMLSYFLAGYISWHPFYMFLTLTAWCGYFFRDPQRVIPQDHGLIISPADGKVVAIEKRSPPSDFGIGNEERYRISIFLNVFDVHVNRIPCAGKIIKAIYYPGAFFNASLDKASDENERQSLVLQINEEHNLAVIQIAGLIARRIRCDVKEGEEMLAGQRIGIIRFGSRVDVYLPVGINPMVCLGQRAVAGETILADYNVKGQQRLGLRR